MFVAASLTGGSLAGLAGGLIASYWKPVLASDSLAPTDYPWSHSGFLQSFDSASLRRGFEVYRNVCATCHSLDLIKYRNLIGVTHTEAQAKALAVSVKVVDGPNDKGEMFERPGRLADKLPAPYPNEEAARYSNGGALPPDLSLIVKARNGYENYIFALLTGYKPAPHGIVLREGLYYNPYMVGGAISMPPPLADEQVDYEDGTPATVSQMAKDVSTFLSWASEPEHDERKKTGIVECGIIASMLALAIYHKRFRWNVVKTKRISYTNRKDFPEPPSGGPGH